MKRLYLDIETIPCQLGDARLELAKPICEKADARIASLQADLKAIAPPANYKDPAKIDEWNKAERPKKEKALTDQIAACRAECEREVDEAWRRTSFDGAYCQIVVIGCAIGDQKPMTLFSPKDKVLTLAAEAQLLRSFYAALELIPEADRLALTWVGHNIIDFDLRVLYQRSVVHGIRPPAWIPFDAKPWGDRVFDTMLAWAGGRGRVSQDKLCRVLGIDAKGSELGDEIDGSKVWDFVRDGRIQDVATYCGGDVHRAREAYQRLTFAQAA
jgi:3'-5' exonuclease